MYPSLRSDLVESRQESGGVRYVVVKDPVTLRFFRLREPEHFIATQLDGKTGPDEITQRLTEKFGIDLPAAAVAEFIGRLEKAGFTEGSLSEHQIARARYQRPDQGKPSLLKRLVFIKLKAFDPDNFLTRLAPYTNIFYTKGFVILSGALFLVAANITLTNKEAFLAVRLGDLFRVGGILFAVFTIFLVIALHELAHAVTCKRYGGRVNDMGVLLLYFQPCLYTNLSDAWLFPQKGKRLLVTFVGAYFQLITWAVATLLWGVSDPDSLAGRFFFIASAVTFISILFNFNPLIKLDGYYLLSDWLEIPNLRQKAFRYLGNRLKALILGLETKPETGDLRERRIYLAYGIFALAYSAFLVGWILSKVAQLLISGLAGFGFLLFLALVGAMFTKPMVEVAREIEAAIAQKGPQFYRSRRFLVKAGVAALLLAVVFFVRYDLRVSRDCRIEALETFTVTNREASFLETNLFREGEQEERATDLVRMFGSDFSAANFVPKVREGTRVRAGDTLAVILSNLYQNELLKAQANYREAKARLELLLRGAKPAEIQKQKQNVEQLRLERVQKERDFDKSKQLFEKRLISQEAYNQAQSDLDIAQAAFAQAQKGLEVLTTPPRAEEVQAARADMDQYQGRINTILGQLEQGAVKSPISGTVLAVGTKGELLSIANLESVRVLVPAQENDLDIIDTGQSIRAKVPGYPSADFAGTVFKISRQGEDYRGKVSFQVTGIVPNPAHLLKPGMTGKAKIYCGRVPIYQLFWRKFWRFVKVEFWSWW